MDDLISRRAARKALCKAVHKGEPIPCDNQTCSCLWSKTRVCDYAREIDNLPPARQWVPCDERLPEVDADGESDYILLSFSNASFLYIGRYEEDEEGGAFYDGDDNMSLSAIGLFVNAWMPLPEPYREDES